MKQSVAQDWRESSGEPWKGPLRGEWPRGRSTEQSGSTPTQLHWDTRTRLLAAASRETGSCRDFWEIDQKQLWSEEKRGEEPWEIPPQNTPLTGKTYQRAITLTVSWKMMWCDMLRNWNLVYFYQGKSWCWDCWSLFIASLELLWRISVEQ